MKKLGKTVAWSLAVLLFLGAVGIVKDVHALEHDLIRLHIRANSDAREDQSLKLAVKDAVVQKLTAAMEGCSSEEAAEGWLLENLTQVQSWAEEAVAAAGSDQTVQVALTREFFPVREYDTFALPAGLYQALRIDLGHGAGQNWWCVVFPSLCGSANAAEFQEAAQTAGFSPELTDTVLEQGTRYEIRFWVLDLLGQLKGGWR